MTVLVTVTGGRTAAGICVRLAVLLLRSGSGVSLLTVIVLMMGPHAESPPRPRESATRPWRRAAGGIGERAAHHGVRSTMGHGNAAAPQEEAIFSPTAAALHWTTTLVAAGWAVVRYPGDVEDSPPGLTEAIGVDSTICRWQPRRAGVWRSRWATAACRRARGRVRPRGVAVGVGEGAGGGWPSWSRSASPSSWPARGPKACCPSRSCRREAAPLLNQVGRLDDAIHGRPRHRRVCTRSGSFA